MKALHAKQCFGLLALLCSSAALAATINIVQSTPNPQVGDSFFVTVSGVNFPETTGATFPVTFNGAIVSIPTNGIVLAPGSPFTGIVASYPFSSRDLMSLVGHTTGSLPSGSFDAFRINFTLLAAGHPDILIIDDGVDFGWTDPDGNVITPTVYHQTSVPLPAVGWLLVPAFALLARRGKR